MPGDMKTLSIMFLCHFCILGRQWALMLPRRPMSLIHAWPEDHLLLPFLSVSCPLSLCREEREKVSHQAAEREGVNLYLSEKVCVKKRK